MTTTREPSAKVAIYARYSTNRQDARSIDDQVRRCRALSQQRGFEVVAEYADAATSGTHTQREELQRLLTDARQKAFRHVVVDDVSRLSRDLGDFWRITFGEFASKNVSVIDATTGLASDDKGARMAFGAMALISDGFIQMIRQETHRGLEGRALAGFATGGKTYGFRTVPECNPPQPDHPRKIRVVAPDEAAIVVRIFEQFAAGTSLKRIASLLNEEQIPAPHDNGRGHKRGRGWGHTTIRSMLRNAQYIGVWIWNKESWVQVPGTNRYRRVPRPESEQVRKEMPELRIVSTELWDRVQARMRSRAPGRSRPVGTGKRGASLVSGLLRCGVCGGSLVVVSRRYKAGAAYANFGCSINRSRGRAVCKNERTISERKVTDAVVRALREQLSSPDLVKTFVDSFSKHFEASVHEAADDCADLERQIEQAVARVKNITAAMAASGFSEALLAQLREEEARVGALKRRLASATRESRPRILPHPRLIQKCIDQLLAFLEVDTEKARAALARHMPPLILTPDRGTYRITGGFNLSLFVEEEPSSAAAPAGESMISEVGGTGIELARTSPTNSRCGAVLQSFSRVTIPGPFRLVPLRSTEGGRPWQRGGNRWARSKTSLEEAGLPGQLFEDGEAGAILGSIRGGFRPDNVQQGRSGRHDAVQIESGHAADQLVVAVRPSGRKSQIDVASVGLEIQERAARKERSIASEGKAALDALGPDTSLELSQRGCQFLEVVRPRVRTDIRVAGSQRGTVERRCDTTDEYVPDAVPVQGVDDDPRLEATHDGIRSRGAPAGTAPRTRSCPRGSEAARLG
jgi:DNA invertase Pin-like site-specific DNA recombinase